jgi:hypothetical protein
MPGTLHPDDLPKIAEYLEEKLNGEFLKKYFVASDGPQVVVAGPQGNYTVNVPTLVPKIVHSCIFFQNGKCSIHRVSPFGCAYTDSHMDQAEGHRRSMWLVKEIAQAHNEHSQYTRSIEFLVRNDRVAAPLQERKEAMAKLTAFYEGKPIHA